MRNYDLDFLKKFSMVIGFLVVVTGGLQLLAYHLNQAIPPEVSPAVAQRTQNRIAPLGAVYAARPAPPRRPPRLPRPRPPPHRRSLTAEPPTAR